MPDDELREIPVERIRPSGHPLRPVDPAKVDELAESIRTFGLQQPIKVRPVGDGYFEIIFGDHRLEALRKLECQTVRCCVQETNEAQAFLMREAENLQRNDYVDPVAEARGFKMLLEQGLTETHIAKSIGRTQQYVSARLGLLRLEPEIQALITSRLVPPEHGYELSKLTDGLTRRILAELSRRDTDNAVTLRQLRDASKRSLDELARDPRVESILLQLNPTWVFRRVVARVTNLEQDQKYLRDAQYRITTLALESHGQWKRDHCTHFNGDICQWWTWSSLVLDWKMTKDGNNWKLRVSEYPAYCATCPEYIKRVEGSKESST